MDIATTNRVDKYTYNPTDRQLARLAVLSGAHMADALEWMEDSGVSFEGPQVLTPVTYLMRSSVEGK
jgi:hypothetical protein